MISGNVHGVEAATGRVDILGNLIGTDASGTAPLPPVQRRGVVFGLASDIRVGGTAPGAGNVIAFNESGVEGFVSGVRVPIRGNRIFSNTNWLGIDLKGNDGVTANDPGDADGGPNGLQNFPVVDAAITADRKTEVNGVLDTAPSAAFTIDLYASDACDPSGYGEGERYLGAAAVTTDGAGHASFSYTTTGAVPAGDVITATATTADGSTSEFSACTTVK